MYSNVSPQQINIVSSHDTKNTIAASEIPKLKRVIQSAVLQHGEHQIVFALFDNLSYMIASVKDENSGSGTGQASQSTVVPYRPIVESTTLDHLEIDKHSSLVEIVCSRSHVYQLLQNQP